MATTQSLHGVKELLECFVQIAPSPRPVEAVERKVEPMDVLSQIKLFKLFEYIGGIIAGDEGCAVLIAYG